jgi:hypothetical protein
MEPAEIGPVFATRTLLLDGKDEIQITIGQPVSPPDWNGNFRCTYRIQGLGDREIIRGIGGVDSLQALYLAMMTISVDLYTSDEGRAGRITWESDRELGLPFSDVIADLVPKRSAQE